MWDQLWEHQAIFTSCDVWQPAETRELAKYKRYKIGRKIYNVWYFSGWEVVRGECLHQTLRSNSRGWCWWWCVHTGDPAIHQSDLFTALSSLLWWRDANVGFDMQDLVWWKKAECRWERVPKSASWLYCVDGRWGEGGREGYHHWVLSLWRKIVPPLCHFVDTAPSSPSTFHYPSICTVDTAQQIHSNLVPSIFRCNTMPSVFNCLVTFALHWNTYIPSLHWQLFTTILFLQLKVSNAQTNNIELGGRWEA